MKHIKTILAATALAVTTLTTHGSFAQTSTAPGGVEAPDVGELSDGEIRRIDKETGKLTIKHGPIKHLDMPPMSMVFTAKDKSLLDTVKVGDKIRFGAVEEAGKMVVTNIQIVK